MKSLQQYITEARILNGYIFRSIIQPYDILSYDYEDEEDNIKKRVDELLEITKQIKQACKEKDIKTIVRLFDANNNYEDIEDDYREKFSTDFTSRVLKNGGSNKIWYQDDKYAVVYSGTYSDKTDGKDFAIMLLENK